MTESQLDQLEKSIEVGGMLEPIVVNKRNMVVIGGHQRLKVLLERFDVQETMCSVVDVDEKTEKVLNLALNKISGFWDDEKLTDLVFELKDDDLIGFEEEEKDQYLMQREMMMNTEGVYNPDDDEEIKSAFSRNEKIPIKCEEPEAPHRKDQLAFYTENFEQYDAVRKFFKSTRQGELDINKLVEIIK